MTEEGLRSRWHGRRASTDSNAEDRAVETDTSADVLRPSCIGKPSDAKAKEKEEEGSSASANTGGHGNKSNPERRTQQEEGSSPLEDGAGEDDKSSSEGCAQQGSSSSENSACEDDESMPESGAQQDGPTVVAPKSGTEEITDDTDNGSNLEDEPSCQPLMDRISSEDNAERRPVRYIGGGGGDAGINRDSAGKPPVQRDGDDGGRPSKAVHRASARGASAGGAEAAAAAEASAQAAEVAAAAAAARREREEAEAEAAADELWNEDLDAGLLLADRNPLNKVLQGKPTQGQRVALCLTLAVVFVSVLLGIIWVLEPGAYKLLDKEFRDAVKSGDTETVRTRLDEEEASRDQVKATDGEQLTALHWAAIRGQTDAAKLLLERRADPMRQSAVGMTPLHYAGRDGHSSIAALLADAGADLNAQDHNEWTAMHWSALYGHVDVTRELILLGADPRISSSDAHHRTAVELAEDNRHNELIPILKNAMKRANERDEQKTKPNDEI